MGKLLSLLSLICICVLGLGVMVFPHSPAFWLVTNSASYQQVRVIIAALLTIQLITTPPRQVWFRIVAGSVAALTGFWVVQQTYQYHMELLDSLAFLGASFAIFATALERNVEAVPSFSMFHKQVSS